MSEDKPFPPSPQKLRNLRERGIIPYSPLLANAGCCIGLTFALKFAWNSYGLQFVAWSESMFSIKNAQPRSLPPSNILGEQAVSGVVFATLTLLGVLLIVSICAIVVGLIQTKMFISFTILKTKGIKSATAYNPINLIASIATLIIFCAISVITFTDSWGRLWQDLAGDFNINDTLATFTKDGLGNSSFIQLSNNIKSINGEMVANLSQVYRLYWIGILCFFIVTGICSRFIATITFTHEHGMTRAEIEAESKEDGISDAVKNAMHNLERSEQEIDGMTLERDLG